MARTKNRGRGPKQKIRDADRRAEALTLRRQGLSYDEIAQRMGYAYPAAAHQIVTSALADLWVEPAEDVRAMELQRLDASHLRGEETIARLDRVIARFLPMAETGDLESADVVVRAETARMKANAGHIRTGESRRVLLGLDAPKRNEVTGKGGGPISLDLSKLSDDELERIARCGTAAELAASLGGIGAPQEGANGAAGPVHPLPDTEVGDS